MALAHARKIVVDGVTYQWQVSSKGPAPRLCVSDREWSPLRLMLTVQRGQGAKLRCEMHSKNQHKGHTKFLADENERNPGHLATLGPKDVATTIRFALQQGWGKAKGPKAFSCEPPPDLKDYGPKGSTRNTLCGCKRALTQALHICPYKVAVDGDSRGFRANELCRCCTKCEANCEMNS